MLLAIVATSLPAFAASPGTSTPSHDSAADRKAEAPVATVDDDHAEANLKAYQAKELALYDALSTDPSPRIQILAARIYTEDSDQTPAALRPKHADVIARAARFAPDDALVQWIAASQGSYWSSACGPTHWPEAEVANLLRLEPDNAAAWQYAVALARAKGDQAGIDDALSRMAATQRADDHTTDELSAWTVAFQAHSEISSSDAAYWGPGELTPAQDAVVSGLGRISYRGMRSEELKAVCKPDAASDRMWQRLGWCTDAARLLAQKGDSLELRKQGLELLAIVGERSDRIAPLQRQYDWLETHAANPMQQYDVEPDSTDLLLADWQNATSEIAAIEHHLHHLGLPATPPASWVKPVSPADAEKAAAADSTKQAMLAYAAYLKALFEDMSASPKAEQRMFAALNDKMPAAVISAAEETSGAKSEGKSEATGATVEQITSLTEGNAGNLKLQWMVATSGDNRVTQDTKAGAIARMQLAESDNAATWTLSLPASGDIADATLQHMAASTRYDTHTLDAATIVLEAMSQRPLPDEIGDLWLKQGAGKFSAADSTKILALSMAAAASGAGIVNLVGACSPDTGHALEKAHRDACIATARMMIEKSQTLMGLSIGESILRKFGALSESDAARTRRVWWWQKSAMPGEKTGAISAYLDDYFASGNEIEALRLNAQRLGATEPPADWKSPAERRATHNAGE